MRSLIVTRWPGTVTGIVAAKLAASAALAVLLSTCKDATEPLHPVPAVSAIAPVEVDQGRDTLTLTVTGSNFVRASVVWVNGSSRETRFVSAAELRATLPATDFAAAGTAQIAVFNRAPGGGTSNTAPLTIKERTYPTPVISTLQPAFVTTGSAAVEVTITGTGFVPQSVALAAGTLQPTTYLSATQLRVSLAASHLTVGATLQFYVANPNPGGGTSNATAFEVRNPVPAITALDSAQTTAGQTGFTLRVTGTGFVSNSQVRFNGAQRPTAVVSPGVLSVTLPEGDLRAPGSYAITVVNPPPGGGTSSALPFTLVMAPPEITLLPSRGAAAGRDLILHIHGRAFVPGSVIRWNGADRPTTYVSGTRVTAAISAADVAQPGTAQITVVNPGGATSSAATMVVRALGAPTATSILLPMLSRDIAFEPTTMRLYASVAFSSEHANSVVEIDPLTGTITRSVVVGKEPGKLALSDDGRYLYVGLDGANAVRRVDLPGLTPSIDWVLSPNQVAGDIDVAPGRPGIVAVSRQVPGSGLYGVTIYDEGYARPTTTPSGSGATRIEFLDSPDILYGFDNTSTGFQFYTIAVDDAGARHVSGTQGLLTGFYTEIVGAAGRIYGSDGSVVDAERRVQVRRMGPAGPVAVDPELGRAYFLRNSPNASEIAVFDLNTFSLLGTIAIPTATFPIQQRLPPRLVRWGSDGLAFFDETRLFIIRSPLIGS